MTEVARRKVEADKEKGIPKPCILSRVHNTHTHTYNIDTLMYIVYKL